MRGPDPQRQGHRAAEPPLKGFAQNQLWCEIVALACELLAWTQMLALAGHRPPLGTQTAPAAPVLRRRAARPQRPPPAAPTRRTMALGRPRSPPPSPACRPSRPADQPQPSPRRPGRSNPQGPWNPAHPARQPGSQPRPGTRKSTTSRTIQASTSGTRKIEVSAFSPGPAATC